MREFRDRLHDILDAIAQIEVEQVKGGAAFDASRLIQVWMMHHLMIIGEAVRAIDPALRRQYPSIPWREIAGMRNILVHAETHADKDQNRHEIASHRSYLQPLGLSCDSASRKQCRTRRK